MPLHALLGIEPAAPGFARVRIEPHLGPLLAVAGSIPTPHGTVSVDVHPPEVRVELPEGMTGTFVWKRREIILTGGPNRIIIDSEPT